MWKLWKTMWIIDIRRLFCVDNSVDNMGSLSTLSTFDCGKLVINSLLTGYPQYGCGYLM